MTISPLKSFSSPMQIGLLASLMILVAVADPALGQTRRRTVTGNRGGSLSTTRTVNPSSNGTFTHSGTYTRTKAQGQSASGSFAGSGSRSWSPDQGMTRTSTTEVTTERGHSLFVDRDHTTTIEGEGVQRTGSTTVTNDSGEVLGSTNTTSTLNQAGIESSTTVSGPRGRSAIVDSTVTPESEGQWWRSTTVSNPEGETLGGAEATIEIERTSDQSWTRQVTGSTTSGRPIDRTISNERVEEDDL